MMKVPQANLGKVYGQFVVDNIIPLWRVKIYAESGQYHIIVESRWNLEKAYAQSGQYHTITESRIQP